MENTNVTPERLQELGIYELRSFARQIGVHSPTQYKKEQLIAEIVAIITGEQTPYVKKSKSGRPPKQMAGFDELMSIFTPVVDENTVYAKPFSSDSIYPSSLMQRVKIQTDKTEHFEGFVRLLDNYAIVLKNGYFEDNDNTFYVTATQVSQFKLKNGDRISGEYYVILEDKPKIVKTIELINGESAQVVSNKDRTSFALIPAEYPCKKLSLSENVKDNITFNAIDKICPIGYGSRVLINFDIDYNQEYFLATLINSLSINHKVTMLATDERPEDVTFLNKQCKSMQMLTRNDAKAEKMFNEQLVNIFDHIQRQVEFGNNQILIIKNLDKLYNFFVGYFAVAENKNEIQSKFLAFEKLKNYLLLGKNTASGKSLTIIALNGTNGDLVNLFNTTINLSSQEKSAKLGDVLPSSRTLKVENLLD